MLLKKKLIYGMLYILQGWIPVTTPVYKRRLLKMVFLPFALSASVFLILNGKIILPRVELVITTKCNLNCKDCANLIPCYKAPKSFPLSELRKEMDALALVLAGIGELKIMGGEPFLHPELGEILNMVAKYKIKKSITLTTNGTIIPSLELMDIIIKNNVRINVSGYEISKKKAAIFMNILANNGIYYEYYEDMRWKDYGNLNSRGRNKNELKEIFSNCSPSCLTYIHGKLHMCPRSGNGFNSGVISVSKQDYIDFNQVDTLNEETIQKLRNDSQQFINLPYITACQYCDGGRRPEKYIPSAIQM